MPKEEYCIAEFSANHGCVKFSSIAEGRHIIVDGEYIKILIRGSYLVYYYAKAQVPCLVYLKLNGLEIPGSRDYSHSPCGGAMIFPDEMCKTCRLTLCTENTLHGIVKFAPVH